MKLGCQGPAIAKALMLMMAAASFNSESGHELPQDSLDAATVVLLHGLARTTSSMQQMEAALLNHGYRVCNIGYPSRKHSIADLASRHVAPAIARCVPGKNTPLNFVTHSLGGIVVRQLARSGDVANFARVVMLGPPNHGSELVDALGDWYLFDALNGPAGSELGTGAQAVPQSLGPADFEVGIIAGSSTINWINSLIIPGQDDGKVSLDRARLEGMRDFIVVPVAHPFLMTDDQVIEQTIRFLKYGCFSPSEPGAAATSLRPPCGE
jgi:triacylglycerol lipase